MIFLVNTIAEGHALVLLFVMMLGFALMAFGILKRIPVLVLLSTAPFMFLAVEFSDQLALVVTFVGLILFNLVYSWQLINQ